MGTLLLLPAALVWLVLSPEPFLPAAPGDRALLMLTGLTTALSVQLGAVLPFAQWPSVNCLNNYADDLLAAPLTIKGGGVRVPEAARIIGGERICGVLMLTAFSQREVVEDARDAGALAYLVKPYQKSDLIPAIEVAIGRFRELQQLSGEVDSLGEQLEARKSIDRAKGVLIDECGLKESEAFTFIQRTAMSERSRMRDVAERILDGSLRP